MPIHGPGILSSRSQCARNRPAAKCPNPSNICPFLYGTRREAHAVESFKNMDGRADPRRAREAATCESYVSAALRLIASRLGATPKAREYSRLNWDALS